MGSTPSHQQSGARQPPEFLVVGRVVRPHGIRGAMSVEPQSTLIDAIRPGDVIYLGSWSSPQRVRSLSTHRGRKLLMIEGCTDRNQAERWRGAEIKIRFEEAQPLEADVYYRWQILGLKVITEQGAELGTVQDILETGANDVYIVKDEVGDELLLPAIPDVILEVDLEAERMIVRLMPGLRPGDDAEADGDIAP